MHNSTYKATLLLSMCLLSACAHLGEIDMRRAKIGMNREQAIASTQGNLTRYSLTDGTTEYILYCVVPSFLAMYSDHPRAVLFVRLENGSVVDRGLVGKAEEKKIKQVSPAFVLREWQAPGPIAGYEPDRQ